MAKDTYIRFRLTETEKDLVKQAAERLNMSMSDFIRSYVVLVSQAVEDVSTGAIGIEMAEYVLRYSTTSILKSAKHTTNILKSTKSTILKSAKSTTSILKSTLPD